MFQSAFVRTCVCVCACVRVCVRVCAYVVTCTCISPVLVTVLLCVARTITAAGVGVDNAVASNEVLGGGGWSHSGGFNTSKRGILLRGGPVSRQSVTGGFAFGTHIFCAAFMHACLRFSLTSWRCEASGIGICLLLLMFAGSGVNTDSVIPSMHLA